MSSPETFISYEIRHPMILLAFDIGNTRTSLGLFRGPVMLSHWETTTRQKSPGRSWREIITLTCAEGGTGTEEVSGCVISSVVPRATREVTAAVRSALHRKPLIVRGTLPLGVRTRYENPATLGPDRACAMAAAYRKYGGPVIVVDCGTAVTIDPVSRSGIHPGGTIAPGLTLSSACLGTGTAALPRTEWSAAAGTVGGNTEEAIRAGTLHGVAGGIREICRRLRKSLGPRVVVVGTGGDASLLQEKFSLFDRIDPYLVLEGACIVYRSETKRRRRG